MSQNGFSRITGRKARLRVNKLMKLNSACIAVGGYGRHYLNAMIGESRAGRIRLAACADPFPPEGYDEEVSALSERPALYPCHRELLKHHAGLDLVTIGTGLHLHYPMLLDALEAGCHVLLAKPAAVTIQSIDAMIAASARFNRKVVVDFQHTYAEGTGWIMEAIAAGRLGSVREITTTLRWQRPDDYYARNNWSGKFKLNGEYVLDGPLSNPHAHYINNALYFAHPDPQRFATPVSVRAELYRLRDLETDDNACAEILTDTGVVIRHYSTLTSADSRQETRIEITGDKGRAVWGQYQAEIEIGGKRDVLHYPRAQSSTVVGQFIDYLNGGASAPLTPLESARCHVLALNGAWESARRAVPIPEECHINLEQEGKKFRAVRGIDALIRDAAASRKLYSEMGCPWARPTKPFDLTGYQQFRL